jgi:DNA-binding NtrC family response regulator
MNLDTSLIGQSPAIKRLKKEIFSLAKHQRHIFIKGEVGTGKSTVARLIHTASGSAGKIITLNPCTTHDLEITEKLRHIDASVSTYLFQEIEEFSFLYQTNIHKFIQHLPKKPFTRVIITAKENPNELQKEGKLIEGLQSTLKSFETISLPRLRERQDDIPKLIEHFIQQACETTGAKLKVIDINALDFLVRREWKGNIKELKAVVEKAVFTSDAEVIELPDYLINEYSQLENILNSIKRKKQFLFDRSLSNLEKVLIERALDAVGYNQTKAAEILNLSEANLRYRLKKFKITSKLER